MVYLRAKTVKGDKYLYLVKSVWDSKKSTARQEIVKYLGKLSKITPQDIPSEYRHDPKISAFFSTNGQVDIKKREKILKKFQNELLAVLKKGDYDGTYNLYKSFKSSSGTTEFYEKILKPVMYEVGRLWQEKKISVGTEHVCSNIASNLVNSILQNNLVHTKKQKILICTPYGEQHNLGCKIIESFLLCKGYRVFNLSPSAPASSILNFMNENKPDFVFMSVTLQDNIKSGQTLIKKIKDAFGLPVIVGGQALKYKNVKWDAFTQEGDLDTIPKVMRTIKKS